MAMENTTGKVVTEKKEDTEYSKGHRQFQLRPAQTSIKYFE